MNQFNTAGKNRNRHAIAGFSKPSFLCSHRPVFRIAFTVAILFIVVNSYSQKNKMLEFSISEIDSLSKYESCLAIFDLGGKINSEITTTNNGKQSEIAGSGNYSITAHSFFTDLARYETLTDIEKRKYNTEKYCKLQRVDYKSNTSFEDGSYQNVDAKFYYDNDALFYIKYEEKTMMGTIKLNPQYQFFYSQIDAALNDNAKLKEWLINQNKEIMKYCIEDIKKY